MQMMARHAIGAAGCRDGHAWRMVGVGAAKGMIESSLLRRPAFGHAYAHTHVHGLEQAPARVPLQPCFGDLASSARLLRKVCSRLRSPF